MESGRGYPNIESLKAITKFFAVTVDELLSSDEVLTIAEEDSKRKETHLRDLMYGVLDLCISMLLFLPLFAQSSDGLIESVSLISLSGIRPYIKWAYLVFVFLMMVIGALTLALQNHSETVWTRVKSKLSLSFGVIIVLIFILSRQPYAPVFSLVLLAIKTLMLIKRT